MPDENNHITFDAEVEKIFKARPTFLIVCCCVLFVIILVLISSLLLGFRFSQKEIFQVRIDSRKTSHGNGILIPGKAEKFEIVLKADSSLKRENDATGNHDLFIKGSFDISKIKKNGHAVSYLKILIDSEKISGLGWVRGYIVDLHPNGSGNLTDFTVLVRAEEYRPLRDCFYFNVNTKLEIELEKKNFYSYIFKTQ